MTSTTKQSLINRYRPETWKELLGHLVQVREFQSAVEVSQVFLIVGDTGVGKTTFARIAAKHHLKIQRVDESNAADHNGVGAARELIEPFQYVRVDDQAIILDEV